VQPRHSFGGQEVFAAPLALAELGVVDAAVLRQRWRDFVRRGGGNLGMNLLFTLQAELWLRVRRSQAGTPSRPSFVTPDLTAALARW
jgi:hypothetical protein